MQICNPLALDCSICKELTKAYNTSINIAAGLTPAANLYLWITDKFGNQYRVIVTIANDGSFNILTSLFPAGMFNQYAGKFDLFLTSDINGTTVVPMNFTTPFNCLKLKITC